MFFSIPAYFFKPIGSTTLKAEVCTGRDVRGPTLKVHFKNGKKIYMWQTVDHVAEERNQLLANSSPVVMEIEIKAIQELQSSCSASAVGRRKYYRK